MALGIVLVVRKKKKQFNNVTEYVENFDRRFNTFSDIL